VCVLAGAVFGGGAEFREAAAPLSDAVQAGGLDLLGRVCAVREVVSLGTGADAGTAAGRAAASLLLLYARRTAQVVAGGRPQFSWAMPAARVDAHLQLSSDLQVGRCASGLHHTPYDPYDIRHAIISRGLPHRMSPV
jgi:hypothetical protein